jgi:hypothetical protein
MKNQKPIKKIAVWITFFAASVLASKTVVAQPDLVPGINYSYNPPGANGVITDIEVDVCNNNSTAASTFDVSMYLYDQSSGNYWIIGTQTLTNGLSGNACITISNWDIDINDTPGIPAGTYRLGIWVDSGEDITETSESNNAGLLSGNINYSPSTGINDAAWMNTVNVYPNPATNNININFSAPEQEPVTINLIDISGRIVKNVANNFVKGTQTISLDLNDVPAGIYSLQFSSNGYLYSEKIVVTK